jgi:HPt (histidine-containing phosphotransfer) domain-containing protein
VDIFRLDERSGAAASSALPPGEHFPTLGIATLLDIFEGDVASVSDILVAACTSIAVDLTRIEQALVARDTPLVREASHRMKGTSGSIASPDVLRLSAALETAAKTDPDRIDPALLASLAAAVAELGRECRAYRQALHMGGHITRPNAPSNG